MSSDLGPLAVDTAWLPAVDRHDSDITKLFATQGRIHKFEHYLPVYEQVFSRYRNRPATVLEIGVAKGGSLELWRNYFPRAVRIVGIDIRDHCAQYDDPANNMFVRIGDQADEQFLRALVEEFGQFDVVLDDGAHTPTATLTAFRYLFTHGLRDGGTYLVEDLSHCYFADFQDGTPPFTEVLKDLIDVMHAPYPDAGAVLPFEHEHEPLIVPLATTIIESITVWDGIAAIRRQQRPPPHCIYRPT